MRLISVQWFVGRGPTLVISFTLEAALISWLFDTNTKGIGNGQECARVAWMSGLNTRPHHFQFEMILNGPEVLTHKLIHVVPILTRIRSAPVHTGTAGLIFRCLT